MSKKEFLEKAKKLAMRRVTDIGEKIIFLDYSNEFSTHSASYLIISNPSCITRVCVCYDQDYDTMWVKNELLVPSKYHCSSLYDSDTLDRID